MIDEVLLKQEVVDLLDYFKDRDVKPVEASLICSRVILCINTVFQGEFEKLFRGDEL